MKAWIISIITAMTVSTGMFAFPSAPIIDRQVWFWEQVFLTYHNEQIIIHDSEYPEIIVDVVDLPKLGFSDEDDEEKWIENLLERYMAGVEKFQKYGERAYYLGSIERRLFSVYRENRSLLLAGKAKLRGQRGLKDIFAKAVVRAAAYLPEMERIFASFGLPKELTRLPFVESMFNVEARSKVGASGIWQFMPATARRYLTVTHYIDERNSPFKATAAAAQLLKRNYRELGNWPLAITAYNHGLYGMKRAVQSENSKYLSHLIKNYRGTSFGFASRNFYAEFLAARRAFAKKYKRNKVSKAHHKLAKITLKKPISPAKLIKSTSLTRHELQNLNRCMNKSLFNKGYHKPLPKNYSFWVPKSKYVQVKRRLKVY